MTPQQAITTLRRFGAPPVLAHPTYTKSFETVLPDLVAAGLVGMEVFYKHYDEDTVARLHEMAKKYDLLPLGGSDYHALKNPDERLPGDIPLPDWAIRDFVEKELPWVSIPSLS